MEQPGISDLSDREALLDTLGNPLPKIGELVDGDSSRGELEPVRNKPRNSNAGRKPFDGIYGT